MNNIKKMKKEHFLDIIEELKSTRSSKIVRFIILMTQSFLIMLILITFYQMKSHTNFFLTSNVLFKTPYGAKSSHITFVKVDGYIRKYDRTKYLALFHSNEKYQRTFDISRCLYIYLCIYMSIYLSKISDAHSHEYTKIEINSGDDLPLEKTKYTYASNTC